MQRSLAGSNLLFTFKDAFQAAPAVQNSRPIAKNKTPMVKPKRGPLESPSGGPRFVLLSD